jgi:hypothetical protein
MHELILYVKLQIYPKSMAFLDDSAEKKNGNYDIPLNLGFFIWRCPSIYEGVNSKNTYIFNFVNKLKTKGGHDLP